MIDFKQRLLMGNACYPSPERRSSKGTPFTNKDTRLTVENWSAVSSSCVSTLGLSHTPPSISVPLRFTTASPSSSVTPSTRRSDWYSAL